VSVLFLILVASGSRELACNLTRESGIVENLSAAGYLGALLAALYHLGLGGQEKKHRPVLFFWIFASLVFLGEEISWGQHFFHFSTPETLASINVQREMNLHNLRFWNAPDWFAQLRQGKIDLRLLFSSANLFRAGFVSYFLLFPILSRRWARLRRLYVVPPDRTFFLVVWPVIGFSILLSLLGSAEKHKAFSETREMIYALAIMFFAFFYLKPDTHGQKRS